MHAKPLLSVSVVCTPLGAHPRPHYRFALRAHHVLAPPQTENQTSPMQIANTAYSSSEPNKTVIVYDSE